MNISIVGGDSRIVELVKILKNEGNNVYLYGLDKTEELQEYNHYDSLEETLGKSDIVVTAIPLSKDEVKINAPFSKNPILLSDFFEKIGNKKIITGNVTENIMRYCKNVDTSQIVDILKSEELAVMNAIPTAEGAIKIAIEKSNITIHGSKCLVLGFGRIGKILAKMLLGIGADVCCEARKQSDIAWIQSYGYKAVELSELSTKLKEADFIFNTIPYKILDEKKLEIVKKNCVIVDLASRPGGINFETAEALNLNFTWALALPGKVAPKTSAQYISKIINNIVISD